MADAALTQLQLAAALAEEIYRRNASDNPIKLSDLGAQAVDVVTPAGFSTDSSVDGLTYYTSRGFVGQVVLKGDTLYVVFRGSDSATSFFNSFYQAASNSFSQTASDGGHQTDLGDFANNVLLGRGTTQQTQLDDALALTRAAEARAAALGKQVVVVGQSLGGGLAGLVSATEGLVGYSIDPAPFQNQLFYAAQKLAFAQSAFGTLLIGEGFNADFLSNSQDNQRKILQANGKSDAAISNYFALTNATWGTYKQNLQNKLRVYSVTGEVLSSPLGALGLYIGGSQAFQVGRTQIDVGVSASLSESQTTAVSLHSPTLFNLLVRTEGTGKQFEDLLKSDEELRYSLFEMPAISGPVEGDRADPTGAGFGGSKVVSSGPAPGILYRALWKTVGNTGGFYDQLVGRIGAEG